MPKRDEDLTLDELEAAIAAENAIIASKMRELIEEITPLKVAEFLGEFEEGDVARSTAGRFRATSIDPDWPSGNYRFVSRPTGLTCTQE